MKNIALFLTLSIYFLISCGDLDYENKEFYIQEVYIINAEATSAIDREVTNVEMHTFVDTFKMLNEQYDYEMRYDNKTVNRDVVFKVGIGGSLPASEDIEVVVGFDEETLNDQNILKNQNCIIPAPSKYSSNVPFDEAKGGFVVTIPKGEASASLKFNIPIIKESIDDYQDFAFPLEVKSTNKDLPISRLYAKYMVYGLTVNKETTINWNGLASKIPTGKYESAQLKGNGAENTSTNGYHHIYKYILPLDAPDEDNYPDQYIIFGLSAWSWEVWAYHSMGWMYTKLEINDKELGTYTNYPFPYGQTDFPANSFPNAEMRPSYENTFDPITRTLKVTYIGVFGATYTDVLTFVSPDLTLKPGVGNNGAPNGWNAQSWAQLKSKGYKYWVPEGL